MRGSSRASHLQRHWLARLAILPGTGVSISYRRTGRDSPRLVCGAPLGGGLGFVEGAAMAEDLAAGGDAAGVDDRAGARAQSGGNLFVAGGLDVGGLRRP